MDNNNYLNLYSISGDYLDSYNIFKPNGIKKIFLPNVKKLDTCAVAECNDLECIILPDNLEKIANDLYI